MAAEASRDAVIAYHRFGYGARLGDLARISDDPRAALKAELQPDKALITPEQADAAGLFGTAANIQTAYAAQAARKIAREQMRAEATAAEMSVGTMMPPGNAPAPPEMSAAGAARAALAPASTAAAPADRKVAPSPDGKPKAQQPQPEGRIYRAEALARFAMAREAEIGLVERLVAFWSNHFCVSVVKGEVVRATAGSFEREAIRPYVLGPVRRHAARGRTSPGHAVLPRQCAIGRPRLARRPESQTRPQREPRPRDHGATHAGGRRRLYPGRRDVDGACHHGLDFRGPRRAHRRARPRSCSMPTCTSPATRWSWATPISAAASARARRR